MKCPKCGYISFDFHQVCPKCSKDISAEQQKLNLPGFRPDPPSLLGALMGEAGESGMHMSASAEMTVMHEEPEISMSDSQVIDAGEMLLEDSQEVDLGLDLIAGGEEAGAQPQDLAEEPALDLNLDGSSETELSKDSEEIILAAAAPLPSLETPAEDSAAEIDLDLEDLSGEISKPDEKALLDSVRQEEEKLGIDLEDFSIEEPADAHWEPAQDDSGEVALDLDEISTKADEGFAAEEKGEISLNLDDLKVNETGELEIGKTMPSPAAEEKPLELEGLQLEEPGVPVKPEKKEEEEDLSLLLSDEKKPESADAEGEGEEALDLDNLDLELDLEEMDRK